MREPGILKRMAIAFVIALLGYGLVYTWIEHQRAKKGPWRVTFDHTPSGAALIVKQPNLGITSFQITFQGAGAASNTTPVTLVFDQPRPVPFELPYGKCVFMDTTFLPGTVAMELYGHQVELLPRVLIIDAKEVPWSTQGGITLEGR